MKRESSETEVVWNLTVETYTAAVVLVQQQQHSFSQSDRLLEEKDICGEANRIEIRLLADICKSHPTLSLAGGKRLFGVHLPVCNQKWRKFSSLFTNP